MIIEKINVQEILKEYNAASKKYHELDKKVQAIHKDNLELAKTMLPKIKQAIVKKVFNNGMCFEGTWMYIEDGGKSMSNFYQLNDLGILRSSKEEKEEHLTISKEDQLDYRWVEPRILDRYFGHYEPKHDILLNELKIIVK